MCKIEKEEFVPLFLLLYKMKKYLFLILLLPVKMFAQVAEPAKMVNVFLGSSGDHGQMSPAASYPFSMLSIGPQTYPNLHMGYEHKAKLFLGFTHNRVEGVGCQGSGGNILIKPFLGDDAQQTKLEKSTESAAPGYYSVGFSNQIKAEISVFKNAGLEHYSFPVGKKGFLIDLSFALANHFIAEEHQVENNTISGWIESGTTCSAGAFRLYYFLQFNQPVTFSGEGHRLIANLNSAVKDAVISVSFSSVSTAYAKAAISNASFTDQKLASTKDWNQLLNRIEVKGDAEREKLFYSMLYRTVQSPYVISEKDGNYRAINGSLQHTQNTVYNGWAIWDNYRTQLPLLSVAYPEKYRDMAASIANLYPYGKKDYATKHEPSNTVRTEHAIVVLLDAYRKGYKIDFKSIEDSLIKEVDSLDYKHPDKALESSYDAWALSQILKITGKNQLSEKYLQKALQYKNYWNKDFKDLTKRDVDQVSARGIYQGTIWQYRWFVPFDVQGLKELTGGEKTFENQLNTFFEKDLYNHANEPDLQVPLLYNASAEPWKSQDLMHKLAVDTVIQYYFNDNSRGIDPFVDVIYQNKPDAYIRTMDDDAGAMSAWFVFTSCGFSPACVGWPVYYLNLPLFQTISFNWPDGKKLTVSVENYGLKKRYIKEVRLNGKKLDRNWITHQEILNGGKLVFTAADQPDLGFGIKNQWISGAAKN